MTGTVNLREVILGILMEVTEGEAFGIRWKNTSIFRSAIVRLSPVSRKERWRI